jgi:hypothetical protein
MGLKLKQLWFISYYSGSYLITLCSLFFAGNRSIGRSGGSYKSFGGAGIPNSLCTCSCIITLSPELIAVPKSGC